MNINYKNVYDLQQYEQAIHKARRDVITAEEKVKEAINNYHNWVAKITGIPKEDLEFSNEYCPAKGICNHVYHIKYKNRYGSPENKCIYCSCDNVDDL